MRKPPPETLRYRRLQASLLFLTNMNIADEIIVIYPRMLHLSGIWLNRITPSNAEKIICE